MGMIPACLLYQYLGPKKLYGEWIPSLSSLLDSFLFLKHAPWWWGCSINMVAPNKENDNLAMDPWCNSTTLTEPDGTSWNKLCNCSLVVLWVVGWKEPILHVNAQLKPPKAYKAITMFFSRNTAESRSAEKRRFQRKFLWPHLGKVPCRPTVSRGVLQDLWKADQKRLINRDEFKLFDDDCAWFALDILPLLTPHLGHAARAWALKTEN